MHRPIHSFRSFSLRGLLIAGAVASLGLPLGREAYGIGGSAIQAAYTPRETVGAAPSVSLVGGSSSSSSAAAIASSGGGGGESTTQGGGSTGGGRARNVSSEDEGSGTTKKRRTTTTRKTTEQGGGTRVAKGGTTTYEPKDQKDYKKAPILEKPADKPLITLSTGFESRYLYHGVDIVGFNSGPSNRTVSVGGIQFPVAPLLKLAPTYAAAINSAFGFGGDSFLAPKTDLSSSVYYFNGDFAFKGFHLGVGYIRAIDPTTPQRESLQNQAVQLNRLFFANSYFTGTSFFTPYNSYQRGRKTYQEVDVNADYTLGIIANVLDATVGYNSYIFPDHDFKGTNYQGEAFGRLTYKQIPYVQPSVTYYRYISDARAQQVVYDRVSKEFEARNIGEYLNGNYIEARIDGAIPIVSSSQFAMSFHPYVLISANDGYLTKQVSNSTRLEFNTVELGAKLPLTYAGRFTVTPYVNYGFDISERHESNDFRGSISPFKEDVWGGVTFSYKF